jgi:predicted nucleic acid-binding protein
MGECTSPQATAIRAGFRDLMAESLRIVPLDPQVIRLAYDLMERHALDGLRPLDAVQLATCLVAQGPTLALADRLLARIARREGVTVCLC